MFNNAGGMLAQFMPQQGQAPQGQGQGGGMGGGMPQGQGGGFQLPPWLAAMRGGNPLGGFMGGQGQQGGFNPLAALQARLGGGQGQGGMQLPPWLGGQGQGGTPIIPQGGGQGAGAQVPQGGGQTAGLWNPANWGAGNPNAQAAAQRVTPTAGAQQPQTTQLQPATGMRSLPQSWNPAGWGTTSGNLGQAQDMMHRNTQVPAQPASIAAGEPNPAARPAPSTAWNPSSWGAGNPDAQSLMHQNTATSPAATPGVTQGTKQSTVPGASQRVRRSY